MHNVRHLQINLRMRMFIIRRLATYGTNDLNRQARMRVMFHRRHNVMTVKVRSTTRTRNSGIRRVPTRRQTIHRRTFPFVPFRRTSKRTGNIRDLSVQVLHGSMQRRAMKVLLSRRTSSNRAPGRRRRIFRGRNPYRTQPFTHIGKMRRTAYQGLIVKASFRRRAYRSSTMYFLGRRPSRGMSDRQRCCQRNSKSTTIVNSKVGNINRNSRRQTKYGQIRRKHSCSTTATRHNVNVIISSLLLILLSLFANVIFVTCNGVLRCIVRIIKLRKVLHLQNTSQGINTSQRHQ